MFYFFSRFSSPSHWERGGRSDCMVLGCWLGLNHDMRKFGFVGIWPRSDSRKRSRNKSKEMPALMIANVVCSSLYDYRWEQTGSSALQRAGAELSRPCLWHGDAVAFCLQDQKILQDQNLVTPGLCEQLQCDKNMKIGSFWTWDGS